MGAASVAMATLLLLLASFVHSQSQWSPQDVYRIDCGASSSSSNVDGLDWEADGKKYVSTGSPGNATGSISVPYKTARIFTSSASYNFPVTPGRHWIRLHFFPAVFGVGFDPSNARFSVSIGSHVLMSNASIVEEIQQQQQNQQPFLMREFSIHAASTTLSIEFVPSGGGGNLTFAFISGIEVVSMAHDAMSPSVIQLGKEQNEQLEMPSTAIQSMYRLNVGGSLVTPANDSSKQGRTWVSDESFLQGVVKGVVQSPPAVAEISYPSGVPEYIAPRSVYGTARTLGSSNTAANAFNLSWIFPVDAGFGYYVRLHFAELVYASPMQRVFSVYINNQTALRGLDIAQQVPLDTPYYRDFVVPPVVGLGSLRLQIGPTPNSGSQYQDAILNGVEIFKLNDTAGNVDGLPVVAAGGSASGKKKKKNTGLILGAAIGGAAAALVLAALALLLCGCRSGKGKKRASSASSPWQSLAAAGGNSHSVISSVGGGSYYAGSVAGGGGGNGRYFTFQEISEATGAFDESRLLGVGGFGRVYKGEIDGGTVHVAVKRGNPRSEQGVAEFHAEIGVLSKLRHRHLVSLIGYCDEGSEMILVYEYMAQGPLRGHLYGSDLPPLTWRQRLDVCVAAARGLHYLHTGADMARAIIHRDVKTTNILLDEHYVAKVSDFGLSKTGPMLDQTHVSTAVKGSFGYLDPEYFRRQQLTDKSDVYSFGVVLVEVMCARPAIDPALPREQVNIAEWAMQAQRAGRLEQILDPYLRGDGGGDAADMASVRKVGETAQKCLAEQGVGRPSMGDVLWNLECALQMQEAAERRRRDGGSGAAGGGGGNNVVEMVPRGLQNGHATGGGDADPNNRRSISHLNGNHDGDDEDYDDDDVYSEDASASAVFSQLVNPQGR